MKIFEYSRKPPLLEPPLSCAKIGIMRADCRIRAAPVRCRRRPRTPMRRKAITTTMLYHTLIYHTSTITILYYTTLKQNIN